MTAYDPILNVINVTLIGGLGDAFGSVRGFSVSVGSVFSVTSPKLESNFQLSM